MSYPPPPAHDSLTLGPHTVAKLALGYGLHLRTDLRIYREPMISLSRFADDHFTIASPSAETTAQSLADDLEQFLTPRPAT